MDFFDRILDTAETIHYLAQQNPKLSFINLLTLASNTWSQLLISRRHIKLSTEEEKVCRCVFHNDVWFDLLVQEFKSPLNNSFIFNMIRVATPTEETTNIFNYITNLTTTNPYFDAGHIGQEITLQRISHETVMAIKRTTRIQIIRNVIQITTIPALLDRQLLHLPNWTQREQYLYYNNWSIKKYQFSIDRGDGYDLNLTNCIPLPKMDRYLKYRIDYFGRVYPSTFTDLIMNGQLIFQFNSDLDFHI